MAVFRVEKNKGFTVMSNHHLNNRTLSLKSKGLLSLMLSLPEAWDYTLRGLSCISVEGVDAIRMAVLELEKQGYITRHQGRDAKGKLKKIEYTIYECPIPQSDNPIADNPITENPAAEEPMPGFTTQSNIQVSNTQSINTKLATIHPSINPDGRSNAVDAYRDLILENIRYNVLLEHYTRERLDEITSLMLETLCSSKTTITIAGERLPAEVVKSRLLKLDFTHIQYVFDALDKTTTKIRNIKAYLLTTLYNAPATMEHYYLTQVNHDMKE